MGIYSPNNAEWTTLQYACARADLILVNVNPAFQSEELAYCLNKVEIKCLVMAESFKKSDYVKILRAALQIGNEATSFRSRSVPHLEHVILLGEKAPKGITSWEDLLKISSQSVAAEL